MKHFEEIPDYEDLPSGPKGFVPIDEIPGEELAPDEIVMEMERMMEEGVDDFKVSRAEDDGVPEAWRKELLAESPDANGVSVQDVEEPDDVASAESKADALLTQEGLEKKKRAWQPGRSETHKVHGREHKERPIGPKLGELEQEM